MPVATLARAAWRKEKEMKLPIVRLNRWCILLVIGLATEGCSTTESTALEPEAPVQKPSMYQWLEEREYMDV